MVLTRGGKSAVHITYGLATALVGFAYYSMAASENYAVLLISFALVAGAYCVVITVQSAA